MQKECSKCGQCCKGEIGPFIFPSDVEFISSKLNISSFDFLNIYCKKHILNTALGELSIYTVKSNNDGCIFLKNNLCEIYENRPYQCINAPYNFLGNYTFWKHMKCIEESDFKTINTKANDITMLKQIINVGYQSFERSK